MSSGTSDTWWPGSFLQIDLWVKMETELVQVISERRSTSRGIKFKSWRVRFFSPLYPSGDIYPSATMTFPMQEDTSLMRFRWQHTCQDSWWHISTRTCKHLRRARGKGDKDTYRPLRLVLISPVQLIKLQLKPGYSSFQFICFMSHCVDKVKPFISVGFN